MTYKIDALDREEWETLCWLHARGYDAEILKLCSIDADDPDNIVFNPISEPIAWAIKKNIEDDPEAFLTCNGSRSLANKLWKFINAIV